MGERLACFKAYDVRGKVPSELNPDIAYRIGRAFADETQADTVCVGHDIRLSGPELSEALSKGLTDGGVDVVDLGLVGTEMVYFATGHYKFDGGIMITASHNPPEYNGMKMVRAESRPISSDTGLRAIELRAFHSDFRRKGNGRVRSMDAYEDFMDHLVQLVPPSEIKPLKILADAGNGAAGVAMEKLIDRYPMEVETMRFEPDGNFPTGVPNPILEESRAPTENALAGGNFDLGVAWDGDYDRCFFFDEHGKFIEGYYIVGLLAESILASHPGEGIVYDPRLTWNTLEIVHRMGGRAIICKSGHAFIKEMMAKENAVYGGEMSAHHYFRDHWFCDSGLIPLLYVARLLFLSSANLGERVADMIEKFPCSGEINRTVVDSQAVLDSVAADYADGDQSFLDGISVEYPEWRFNLRTSNTEPVIRLNVESRGDVALMQEKTEELLRKIG